MNAGLALSSPTANAATESYPDYAVSPVITAANRSNPRTGTGPNNGRNEPDKTANPSGIVPATVAGKDPAEDSEAAVGPLGLRRRSLGEI